MPSKPSKPSVSKAKKVKKAKANKAAVAASFDNKFDIVADDTATAHVNVTFLSGLGQLAAILFRNGVLVSQGSVNNSGAISLGATQQGDIISINGVCTGTAQINIDVSTTPTTPKNFAAGNIHHLFMVM